MQAVSYGGGTNSTAVVVELLNRGEPVDVIVFSDTGGEKPHTYTFLKVFDAWLRARGACGITVIKKGGRQITLEDLCLERRMLPSLAYGYKGCSHKFKIQPQEKFYNNLPAARAEWKAGRKVTKVIGYDIDEERRAKIREDKKYVYRYPLIEWEYDREDCERIIREAGLALPGKSSCFFCPASTKPEILQLREQYPELLARALKIEASAQLSSVKGLGRRFSWSEFLAGVPVSDLVPEADCGCYDG